MKYYVYIFLDPRKPGKYVYGEFEFKYEPFYIGKGKNKRISVSLNETCFFKSNKVKSIRNDGFEPINFKLYTGLFEYEAIIKEIELIKLIGRFDKKIGPLCNLTDGGDGVSGRINNSETKKTMSKSRKLFLEKNPEAKIKLINAISPYWIKNKNVLKNWVLKNPGHLDKIRNTNGSIEKISKNKKDWWDKHPEEKKILSGKNIERYKKDPTFNKGKRNGRYGNGKHVCQYSLDGAFIKEYISGVQAEKELKKSCYSNILKCCKGKTKTAIGFIWKFNNKN